jgi:hypothetical protein
MKEISAALVKAQKEFGPALKTSSNPHFRSKYADLSACVEAVIDGLNNNGIFLMQPTHLCEDGVIVETLFIHESGEQMSAGKLHVPASKQDAQGYGSTLTYARRYALMAACGIAPEDDDGNAASKKPTAEAKPPAPPPPAPPAPTPKAEKPPAKAEGEPGKWQITVKTKPDATPTDFINIVSEMSVVALEQAKSQADVMEIFKVNRALFDKMKAIDAECYKDLMEAFTTKKNALK